MKNKFPAWSLVLIACCLSAISGRAHAAQFGFYVGGHYGDVSKDADTGQFGLAAAAIMADFEFTPAQFNSTYEDQDSTYGFVVGYRLWPHLAIEGGYMDLGSIKYRNTSAGTYNDGPDVFVTSMSADTGGVALSALGILPLSYRWEVYGRVGALLASNELSIFIADSTGFLGGSDSKSSVHLLGGAGISFSFAEIYGARLEYQRVFDAGDETTLNKGDVDLITLGITVAF